MLKHNLFNDMHRKGLTLVELTVSALILTLTVGAVYSIFVSTTKYTISSRAEIEARKEALGWLERIRSGGTGSIRYGTLADTGSDVDLNNVISILPEDYATNWVFANKVDNLTATYTVTEMPNLGSGVRLKRVQVKVEWDTKI
jgi:Tfp pilus assembly protein PilV